MRRHAFAEYSAPAPPCEAINLWKRCAAAWTQSSGGSKFGPRRYVERKYGLGPRNRSRLERAESRRKRQPESQRQKAWPKRDWVCRRSRVALVSGQAQFPIGSLAAVRQGLLGYVVDREVRGATTRIQNSAYQEVEPTSQLPGLQVRLPVCRQRLVDCEVRTRSNACNKAVGSRTLRWGGMRTIDPKATFHV